LHDALSDKINLNFIKTGDETHHVSWRNQPGLLGTNYMTKFKLVVRILCLEKRETEFFSGNLVILKEIGLLNH
jgi:hypothetical protein